MQDGSVITKHCQSELVRFTCMWWIIECYHRLSMNYWSKTPADSTMSTTENPNADCALKPPSHKNTNYVMAGVLFPQLTCNRAFRCSLTRST